MLTYQVAEIFAQQGHCCPMTSPVTFRLELESVRAEAAFLGGLFHAAVDPALSGG